MWLLSQKIRAAFRGETQPVPRFWSGCESECRQKADCPSLGFCRNQKAPRKYKPDFLIVERGERPEAKEAVRQLLLILQMLGDKDEVADDWF